MAKEIFRYRNADIEVIWKPSVCIHSRLCWTQLLAVFNLREKPWVKMDGATTERIIEQVNRCPSGALSFEWIKEAGAAETAQISEASLPVVEVSAKGPLIIRTGCVVNLPDGQQETRSGTVALCRCGGSQNKPFCDGSHARIGFEG